MAVFAIIGFGELGSSLAAGLGRSGKHEIRVYVRDRSGPGADAALATRIEQAGVRQSHYLGELAADATAILSAVPGSAAREVVRGCAPGLAPGVYYVDLTAAPVAHKREGAALVSAAGGRYVDAAVLGTVAASGFEVSIAASGPGAHGWQKLVAPEGLNVDVLDAPAGHATLLKLLRSVYTKGRDALVVEMLLAARHYGLEQRVAESIAGPGEEVPFPALAERVLSSVAIHAGRRGDELGASGDVVHEAHVEPVMARAAQEVLGRLAELGLRDAFDGKRPADAGEVLSRIEALSKRRPLSNRG
jgi:3-hydroxyisobutyrate dehydrogenase-like beta-hydroxyacid dehydrogenase